jgi:hypothetical protein
MSLHLMPLLLTYVVMLILAREVWVRRHPPGRHRPSTAPGMGGWQSHVGLQDGDASVFRTVVP